MNGWALIAWELTVVAICFVIPIGTAVRAHRRRLPVRSRLVTAGWVFWLLGMFSAASVSSQHQSPSGGTAEALGRMTGMLLWFFIANALLFRGYLSGRK